MAAELLQIAQPVAALEPDSALPEWITTTQLGELAGIDPRNARTAAARCFVEKQWRGCTLNVKRKGRELLVHGLSLPEDLRDKWHKRYKTGTALALPDSPSLEAPSTYHADIGKRFAELRWKIEVLAPALAHPKGSNARGEALRAIAGKEYTRPDGKVVTPARTTLGEWLRTLETKGEAALPMKRRPKGSPRVIINRAWDAACPLPEDTKRQIKSDLETYLKTEWAKGVPGVNRVIQFASSKLVELSRIKGWADANLNNCDIGRYLAEQYRNFSIIALKERNAKEFFDKLIPRIKVNRENLKLGDVVVGDVHPFDVAKNEGGRSVHARLICWLDLATYDIFVTVVILSPGRGIRQEDIARSFVDMVQAWGLPKQLRLDNGKEYKWGAMMEGFNTLAGMARNYSKVFLPTIMGEGEEAVLLKEFEPRHHVSRARPYNAPAKQIESVFGILEYNFFAMMPGWIGGDRMNKRTHKVGEAPKAHEGADADFLRDINICLDLYRNTEQAGGSSPNDKRRAAYDAGHTSVRVDLWALIFAFSEVRKFTVHNAGVNVDGAWGICDEIIPLIGQRVEIRVAKWYPSHTFYHAPAGTVHAIPMGVTYDHDDPAGAVEQGRMVKVLNTYIRELKAEIVDIDLMAEADRHRSHLPPSPQLPEGIRITTTEGAAITAALEAAIEPPQKLKPGERIHPTTGARLTIAAPKENRPDGKTAPGLPLPVPAQSNQVATRFDPFKNLHAIAKST